MMTTNAAAGADNFLPSTWQKGPAAPRSLPTGVWPVMLTPFTPTGAIDWDGVAALTEWYLAAGVAGLFAVCLSSEMYQLTDDERRALAARIVRQVAGRVPVVAGGAFGDSIPAQAAAVQRLAETGVAAVVVSVNALAAGEDADTVWQQRMAELLALTGDLPLGLYECPRPYHRLLSPDLLGWAASTGRILFHKDTVCALGPIRAKVAASRGTPLGWYNAHCPSLLDSLRSGGHGYSGIAANFYPDLFVRLCTDYAHQPENADRLQRFLTLADGTIRHRYPASAKRWLALQGLPISETCRVAVPAVRADDDERLMLENLRHLLEELKESAREPGHPAGNENCP